jgi:predicted transcriptional regulator
MVESPETLAGTIESLKSLGLTKYEALVYIALLQAEGASASEIHEISTVPRASVYPVLDRLVQKNLVSVSHSTPRRYNAAPPVEGIDRMLRYIEKDAQHAREALTEIYRNRTHPERGSQELIWTINGEENIQSRLLDLTAGTERSLDIVSSWTFLGHTLPTILPGIRTDVTLRIIIDHWEGEPPTGAELFLLPPLTHTHTPHQKLQETAGVFIIDQTSALVLMGGADVSPTALYSGSQGFVNFFIRYWEFIANLCQQTVSSR